MFLDIEKIDQIDDPEELLNELKKWDGIDSERYRLLYDEWEKNFLFFLGKQWIEKRVGTDGYEIFEEDDEHFRPVTNYLRRNCNIKRSQILGKKVHASIKPNSEAQEDYNAARLGGLALKALHSKDNEDAIQRLAFLHAQVFGGAWRSDFKRPKQSEYIEIPQTVKNKNEFFRCVDCNAIDETSDPCKVCGCPNMEYTREENEEAITGMDGNPLINRTPVYETAVAVIDAFRMKCSPCARLSDATWIQESSIQSLEWAKVNYSVDAEGYYPDVAQNLVKRDKLPRALQLSHEFQTAVSDHHSALDNNVSMPGIDKEMDANTILHRKLYYKGTPNRPKGRLIVWCDSGILFDGKPDLPESVSSDRWHTYGYFPYDLHPMRVEGISYIQDQIPINIKINALDAMVLEHLDRSASPDRVQFTNVIKNNDDNSDGIIEITPRPELPSGGAPFYLNHPQLSSEVYKMRERYVEEIREAGNVTEVMRGVRPTGVDTYRGVQLLRDAADSAESELYGRWHDFLREAMQLKLALIQECLINNDPELSEIMSVIKDNENISESQVQTFTGEDIRNNLNVVIEEVDYVGQSKTAEANRAADMLRDGLVSPQDMESPLVRYDLLKKLGFSTITMKDSIDIEKAERIIDYTEKGDFQTVMQMIRPYDNIELMLDIFTNWMKTAKYEALNPQIKQFAEMQLFMPLQQKIAALRKPKLPPPGGEGGPPPPVQQPPR